MIFSKKEEISIFLRAKLNHSKILQWLRTVYLEAKARHPKDKEFAKRINPKTQMFQ